MFQFDGIWFVRILTIDKRRGILHIAEEKAPELGAIDYLTKPLRVANLKEAVVRLLRR